MCIVDDKNFKIVVFGICLSDSSEIYILRRTYKRKLWRCCEAVKSYSF